MTDPDTSGSKPLKPRLNCIRFSLMAVAISGLLSCSQSTKAPSPNPDLDAPTARMERSSADELEELDGLDELDRLDDSDLEPGHGTGEHHDGNSHSESRWLERSFSGNSRYTITSTPAGELLQGETDGQASVLYRQEQINIHEKPYLHWDWKIRNTFDISDERSRQGDDFPVRVYVVVQEGPLPWDTLAINYVWSSQSPIGEHWRNPFSDKAIMVVLNTGDQRREQWISHTRHVANDFQRYHGIDISAIDGYAYMIDGDNSDSTGVSWVRAIQFSAEP